ncbi:MAG: protein kinase [Polyangiaceae bacterium]|nr:protein kinase [Polyangiaceae bacterium]
MSLRYAHGSKPGAGLNADQHLLTISQDDHTLSDLRGITIQSSSLLQGATYELTQSTDADATTVTYLAHRRVNDSTSTVSIKVIRPTIIKAGREKANLLVQKEGLALARLAQRVPPTPFVVRLVETGSLQVMFGVEEMTIPWLALEYVHGGVEGTSLGSRVAYCIKQSGYAFDAARAANALACICHGVDAIHEAGVLHRDLRPSSIRCSGFAEGELFKIADFALARPKGAKATFHGTRLGEPGYAPPEQLLSDGKQIGRATDIFSVGCLTYRILTGEDLFKTQSVGEALAMVNSKERRGIRDAIGLHQDLRARPWVCQAIDNAIALATRADPRSRPDSGASFLGLVLSELNTVKGGTGAPIRRERLGGPEPDDILNKWEWNVLNNPGGPRVLRDVSWESDGMCLAATTNGLEIFNGLEWLRVDAPDLDKLDSINFVNRYAPGQWFLGGSQAGLAFYSRRGVRWIEHRQDRYLTFERGSGDPDDLAVLVASAPDSPPQLHAIVGGRWLSPVMLKEARVVTGISRLDEERWLVIGRTRDNFAFMATYSPLAWDALLVPSTKGRTYLACAGQPGLGLVVIVGTDGVAMRFDPTGSTGSLVEDGKNISAVAVDGSGRAWAAGAGQIWFQSAGEDTEWTSVWKDPGWEAPFVSVSAEMGRILAVTADGGVVEGHG